jgi:hypothetical protein
MGDCVLLMKQAYGMSGICSDLFAGALLVLLYLGQGQAV